MNWYSIGSEVVMQTAWMLNGMALYWLFIDKPNRMSQKNLKDAVGSSLESANNALAESDKLLGRMKVDHPHLFKQ